MLQIPGGVCRISGLMAAMNEEQLHAQVLLLSHGCEALYTQPELEQRLRSAAESGSRMRIKFGLDPTAPDIHLGHTVQLKQVRKFQDLGHTAVLIIGDYTARIGDPSGVNKTRPVLSTEQIEANAATYLEQAGKVLDVSPEKLEIRHNSEWLGKLKLADIVHLAAKMTVARIMERDTFDVRYKAGSPIGVHELLYPLLQGYDSVCVEADVEIGGTDQTFNNLVGRDLQQNAGQPPQVVMMFPLLVGLDGKEKMSKSKGNCIGVTDALNDMFGKVMSIPDTLMENYFTLLTDLPPEKIAELVDTEQTHPRQAKALLGKLIVGEYYDDSAAEAAATEFDRVFARGSAPTDMPEIAVAAWAMNIVTLIVTSGFAKSTSEARRLVQQNAVRVDEEKIADIEAEVQPRTGMVLRVGKRRFGRIVVRQ